MSFYHGRGTSVLLNGADVSQFMSGVEMNADADVADTSTFKSNWKKALVGQSGVKVSLSGLYDPSFETIAPLLGAEAGDLLEIIMADGANSRLIKVLSTAYAETSPVGGAVSFKWAVLADGAIGFGRALHAFGTEASGGTSAYKDLGTAAVGAVAQLHATAATSLAVHVEDASIPSGGSSNWATVSGGTFATRSSAGAERLEIAGTLRRYVRTVWTGSGTFSVDVARV